MRIHTLRRTVVVVAFAALLTPAASFCLTQRPHSTRPASTFMQQLSSALDDVVRFVLQFGANMDGNGLDFGANMDGNG